MVAAVFLLVGAIVASVASAAVTGAKRDTWTDPPFSVSTDTMAAAVTCPNGIQNKAGGIVFLVHGTRSTGSDSWSKSPYNLILPTTGQGYDICWVDLPGHSLGNSATAAEYVAYNVKQLVVKSATGKVFVIEHSQGGGCNIPWALDFFPSIQQVVSGFVALSGDFHGYGNKTLLSVSGILPSHASTLYQQEDGSQYLRAQNINGGRAIIGTTSLITLEDEFIQPQPASSTLEGASNIIIQSPDACGPLHIIDHELAPFDSGYFGVVLDALAHGGVADAGRVDKAYCAGFKGNSIIVDPLAAAEALNAVASDALNILTADSPYASTSEPPLPEYVCQRYPSSGFNCSSGFLQ